MGQGGGKGPCVGVRKGSGEGALHLRPLVGNTENPHPFMWSDFLVLPPRGSPGHLSSSQLTG